MTRKAFYIVNAITLYRLGASLLLAYTIVTFQPETFKWLLAISFITDAVDGYLARRFKVSSILGSRIDSLADDVTVIAAVIGMIAFKPVFLVSQIPLFSLLAVLYIIQFVLALVHYGKTTSFHTYTAKFAAIMQAIFFILLFFLPEPVYFIFNIAIVATYFDLLEEIILVLVLPEWRSNVKGLYWIAFGKTKH